MLKFKDFINKINEGLIKTHDGNKCLNEVLFTLNNLKYNVSGEFKDNIIKFTFVHFNGINTQSLDIFFNYLDTTVTNKFGWFPSAMKIVLLNGMVRKSKYNEKELYEKHKEIYSVEIEYDAKFDVVTEDVPEYLYHLTIGAYVDKILKNGLSPHPDRIYFCKNIQDCKNLIPQMMMSYSEEFDKEIYIDGNKKLTKNIKWYILQIKNKNYTIYHDNRYVDGYYILENVPPADIKIIEHQ